MKKKKVLRVILIIGVMSLLTVTGFISVDRVRFDNGENPIFAVDYGAGCDCRIYEGIGYSIIYPCPLTTVDDPQEYPPYWSWFWEE